MLAFWQLVFLLGFIGVSAAASDESDLIDGPAFTKKEIDAALVELDSISKKGLSEETNQNGSLNDLVDHEVILDTVDNNNEVSLWKDKTIPYRISSHYDDYQRAQIVTAITAITNSTCVKFKDYEKNTKDPYINITPEAAKKEICRSYVGCKGGMQEVFLGSKCFGQGIGTAIHELMHTLGIHHEHQRPDQNNYMKVLDSLERMDIERIMIAGPPMYMMRVWHLHYHSLPLVMIMKFYDYGSLLICESGEQNYKKRDWGHAQDACEEYNWGSIMHYPEHSNDGPLFKIISYKAHYSTKVGQRYLPNEQDIKKIKRLYKCDATEMDNQLIKTVEKRIKPHLSKLMNQCNNCATDKQNECRKMLSRLLYC